MLFKKKKKKDYWVGSSRMICLNGVSFGSRLKENSLNYKMLKKPVPCDSLYQFTGQHWTF